MTEQTLSVKTTLWHHKEHYGSVARAHGNLVRIAETLVDKKCFSPSATLSATDLALFTDMDRGNILRLLKNRPGFTKVIKLPTPETGRNRSVGWYISYDFIEEAKRQGQQYYPYNTAELSSKPYPAEQVLSGIDIVTEAAVTSDNIDYDTVEYRPEGLTLLKPVLIDVLSIPEGTVGTIFHNTKNLSEHLHKEIHNLAEASRKGESYNSEILNKVLVNMTSIIAWLKNAQDRPEYQLLLHDIMKSAPEES